MLNKVIEKKKSLLNKYITLRFCTVRCCFQKFALHKSIEEKDNHRHKGEERYNRDHWIDEKI
jgi:hypothetical protein